MLTQPDGSAQGQDLSGLDIQALSEEIDGVRALVYRRP
jgi:hypothetical protein